VSVFHHPLLQKQNDAGKAMPARGKFKGRGAFLTVRRFMINYGNKFFALCPATRYIIAGISL
jgi:hypothetical protein